MRSLRRLLSRQSTLNKKLRKAVAHGKLRLVADLLEAGASSTWMEEAVDSSDDMNALLLACHYGDVAILDVLLDAFFETPQLLQRWGRRMYYVVIRNGHWKAFRRIYDRNVPLDSVGSVRSKLPAPVFIAAETGQTDMLRFLIKANAADAAAYAFHGHSLLSIASKNGHYDCVEALLSQLTVRDEMLDFAIDVARNHSQAHVLVLLTSCLPQYNSNPEPMVVRRPSVTFTLDKNTSQHGSGSGRSSGRSSMWLYKSRRSSLSQHRQRASLAETEILSAFGDDDNENDHVPRRSSTWLYESERDLNVYHPYLESDDDDGELAKDAEEARRYEAYIQGMDAAESEVDWTSTPPVPQRGSVPRSRSLSIESEEKTEETLARIAERREAAKQNTGPEQAKHKKKTWFYHDEVILPYEASDDSTETTTTTTTTTTTATPNNSPPLSAKPPLPPSTKRRTTSFQLPPTITQVSRKLISLRSTKRPLSRASM